MDQVIREGLLEESASTDAFMTVVDQIKGWCNTLRSQGWFVPEVRSPAVDDLKPLLTYEGEVAESLPNPPAWVGRYFANEVIQTASDVIAGVVEREINALLAKETPSYNCCELSNVQEFADRIRCTTDFGRVNLAVKVSDEHYVNAVTNRLSAMVFYKLMEYSINPNNPLEIVIEDIKN